MILGLDVSSTNVGWALLETKPPYYINSGVIIQNKKDDHITGGRFCTMQRQLREILTQFPTIEHCIIENVVYKVGKFGSVKTLVMLSGYWALAISVLQELNIPVTLRHPSTTKSILKVVKVHKEPKVDVHKKVKELIPLLNYTNNEDELDATSLALSHIISSKT